MCDDHQHVQTEHRLDRRTLLRGTGAVAAAAVTFSAPQVFQPAHAGPGGSRSISRTYTGHFTGVGTPDWHYVPVDVPRGVREIEVSYDYESTSTPVGITANVIDIG